MNIPKILLLVFVPLLLSACGTGKFFIERGIKGMERDISDGFKDYADFNDVQEAEIDFIAKSTADWVKSDRLAKLSSELELIASDLELDAIIRKSTWDSTVAFIERPITMSKVPGLVERIAKLCHGLTEEQASNVLKKLKKDHAEQAEEQSEQTLEKQNRKFARALKIVFAEMGISRSKTQLKMAKEMLKQRQSHIDLQWQEELRNHAEFVSLIKNRSIEQGEYVARFTASWAKAEQGAKHLAPEKWENNAKVAHQVINYLLEDLSSDQRVTAALNIREYAELFTELSVLTP